MVIQLTKTTGLRNWIHLAQLYLTGGETKKQKQTKKKKKPNPLETQRKKQVSSKSQGELCENWN
jgi:hypothetical protein